MQFNVARDRHVMTHFWPPSVYIQYSIIEFTCFSVHVGLLFNQLLYFKSETQITLFLTLYQTHKI